jgi:hypothetical protein
MDPGQMRAGDADRERVAERLRIALDEGRLNLHEYDERLRDAYSAKTYAELDQLLHDLPGTVPASQSALATTGPERAAATWQAGPDGRYSDATRRWLVETWGSWGRAVGICVVIWAFSGLFAGGLVYFWPGWVAGPWGVVLLVQTIAGLSHGEPQRWAAKRARREAEREVRREARRRKSTVDES